MHCYIVLRPVENVHTHSGISWGSTLSHSLRIPPTSLENLHVTEIRPILLSVLRSYPTRHLRATSYAASLLLGKNIYAVKESNQSQSF